MGRSPFALPVDWRCGVLRHLGLQLGRAVFNGGVRQMVAARYSEARRNREMLRLRISVPSELVALPFECMAVPEVADGQYLALTSGVSLVRGLVEAPNAVEHTLTEGPLRVVVLGPSAREGSGQDLEGSFAELVSPASDVGIEMTAVRGRALRAAMLRAVEREYEILHVVGYRLAERKDGRQILESPAGIDRLSVQELSLLASRISGLRVVCFSPARSCRSAIPTLPHELGTALFKAGIAAVVVMPVGLEPGVAPLFWHTLLGGLAAGASLDQTVAQARRTVREQLFSIAGWSKPMVFLNARAGQVVRLKRPSQPSDCKQERHPEELPVI